MTELEKRVLIHTFLPKDAELISSVLSHAGLLCHTCLDLQVLETELKRGAGALLTVEEALASRASAAVSDYVAKQAPWSDLPILVLTRTGGDSHWVDHAFERLGNLTLLERPIRSSTLVSAARSALRARKRQYEIRLADLRKDEFLAMLAHELRNPLSPIGAAAELLDIVYADPEKVRQSSKIINRQVKHMTSLIDDLLDVARVTRGLVSLQKKPLNITSVLNQTVEQVTPLIGARNHQLALYLPPAAAWVIGDEKRLVQVFANILTNAGKYTPEGGNISVKLNVKVDTITLEISDNGIGMTQQTIDRIFNLFAQAERDSARSQGGLGLGLALVKSLLELHDGHITAKSDGLGCGSTFVVTLPRVLDVQNEDALTERSVPQAANSPSLRILVVDDNVDAANTLELLLSMIGHQVGVAYLANDAIEQAKKMLPQVCLVDIGLPDMNGKELAKRFRSMPEVASSLLVAVTGYGQEQDIKESRLAGFDHHLVKPVNMERLYALLART